MLYLREERGILQSFVEKIFWKLKKFSASFEKKIASSGDPNGFFKLMGKKVKPKYSDPALVDNHGVSHFTTKNKAKILGRAFEGVKVLPKDLTLSKHYLLQLFPLFLRCVIPFDSTEMGFGTFEQMAKVLGSDS